MRWADKEVARKGTKFVRHSVLALAVLMLTLQSATAADRKDPSMTIRGVGLGSSPAQIVKVLGKPAVETRLTDESGMGMGQLMELIYDGTKFDLCKPEGHDDFHTWRLLVTGSEWLVDPELRVGMTSDDAREVLGKPRNVSKDRGTGRETLHYKFASFDGWYWVSAAKGTMVQIGAAEDWS